MLLHYYRMALANNLTTAMAQDALTIWAFATARLQPHWGRHPLGVLNLHSYQAQAHLLSCLWTRFGENHEVNYPALNSNCFASVAFRLSWCPLNALNILRRQVRKGAAGAVGPQMTAIHMLKTKGPFVCIPVKRARVWRNSGGLWVASEQLRPNPTLYCRVLCWVPGAVCYQASRVSRFQSPSVGVQAGRSYVYHVARHLQLDSVGGVRRGDIWYWWFHGLKLTLSYATQKDTKMMKPCIFCWV